MKKILSLVLMLFCPVALLAQQTQSGTAPLERINTKYNNGVGIGYWPTAGSGLTLNIQPGTANCSGTMVLYGPSAGTLTMTASTTNYVYLNTASSCVPAVKTTTFTSSDIAIATVITGTSTITATCIVSGTGVGTGSFPCIQDDRTLFVAPGGSATSTNPQLTVGSSLAAGSWSGLGIPSTGLTVGDLYYMGSGGLALAEANASTTVPANCVAISTTLCAFSGVFRFSSTQSWTVGAELYVSDVTAGAIVQTVPSTSGHFVQKIGEALAADTLLITPSLDVGGIE